MDTNILLIKPISYLQKAKRDELAEFCRLHDLVVGCTGRRGQSVKPDFVDAIWAYKQRFINNNSTTGRATRIPQKRTNDDTIQELQQHIDALGGQAQVHVSDLETAVTAKRQKVIGGRINTVVQAVQNPVVLKSITVQVRLFQRPKDWNYERQAQVNCGPQGELDLQMIAQYLDVKGSCQIIDPRNSYPFYLYNGTLIDKDDVKDLMEDGYLRIVAQE